MKSRIIVITIALVGVVALGAVVIPNLGRTDSEAPAPARKRKYQCSMHPQIVSNEPGTCPICQMKLQPVDEPEGSTAAPGRERRILFYRHPMRPDVTSPRPAKDEMGMDYVPVYDDEAPGEASDVPGHAGFTLTTERQQLIGITRGRVERRDLEIEIRAAGHCAYDPDLYRAIVEYRQALKARTKLEGGDGALARSAGDALVEGAALRLRQRGMSPEQISAMRPHDPDPVDLLLPGKAVWVYAQIYEYEAHLVRPGQPVTVTIPSLPGVAYQAHVAAVDPILDPTTRSVRVRAHVQTPDEGLRPETFVRVAIHVPLGRRLAVPRAAVLDTGERQIVFAVRGEGDFEPRAVKLGREAQGYYEVLDGLTDGDEVVTSANFLIDSESRFRAALAAFSDGAARGVGEAAP